MDQAQIRSLANQLAEDIAWLEEHSRGQSGTADRAGALRLAAALVRNVIAPFLEDQPALPLHLAVVGGAGAGKSTIANLFSGSALAESNPQAGFTRHPIAFVAAEQQIAWPAHLGFLGKLERLTRPAPSSLDEDVYQVRRVPREPDVPTILDNYIVWDCPDMTTWAAGHYVTRLLEIAGLADVIVYVASDERYNDEVPTQFLQLFLQAGKLVVVCLVKMREADAPALVEHFRKEVLGRLQGQPIASLFVPHLTREQLADPVRNAAPFRIPLLNQAEVLAASPDAARRQNVRAAVTFLQRQQKLLLGVAQNDVDALKNWQSLVREGRFEFEARYRREFLNEARFYRFDEALVKLLELLELPGVGKVLSTTLTVLRTPYRLLKGLFNKALQRPPATALPERPILEGAFNGWLDQLRKEASRRSGTHPFWTHVAQGFATGLGSQARDIFEQGCRNFETNMAVEVDRTARAIYEDLEKNPIALNTLRGSKFAIEIGAIVSTLVAGGLNVFDFVLVPLAASVTHQLVELLGKQYVDSQREQARERQQAMVGQYLAAPLAEWLSQWPISGGSTFQRLQQVLQRLPGTVHQVAELIDAKVREQSAAKA